MLMRLQEISMQCLQRIWKTLLHESALQSAVVILRLVIFGRLIKHLCSPIMQGTPGGLDAVIGLPGGYFTSRRDALKLVALAGGLGSFYVLLTRTKVSAASAP